MAERFLDLWRGLPRWLRVCLASMVGGTIILIGLVMLVTPGPAIVVIPIGLAVLAAELAWVRRLVRSWVPERWQPDFIRNGDPEEGSPGPKGHDA